MSSFVRRSALSSSIPLVRPKPNSRDHGKQALARISASGCLNKPRLSFAIRHDANVPSRSPDAHSLSWLGLLANHQPIVRTSPNRVDRSLPISGEMINSVFDPDGEHRSFAVPGKVGPLDPTIEVISQISTVLRVSPPRTTASTRTRLRTGRQFFGAGPPERSSGHSSRSWLSIAPGKMWLARAQLPTCRPGCNRRLAISVGNGF